MNTIANYYYLEDIEKVAKEDSNRLYIYDNNKWREFDDLIEYLIGNNNDYKDITEEEANKLIKN